MKTPNHKLQISNRGFTIFFAMLVGSLALSIGLAIYDLTLRELDLSATATQSQYAIYAADTGVECALYWDAKYVNAGNNNNGGSNSAFASSSLDTLLPANGSALKCNTVDITAAANRSYPTPPANPIANAATTNFTLTFLPQPYCTIVQVAKVGNPSKTVVTAKGYNTCATGGLRIERVLQAKY